MSQQTGETSHSSGRLTFQQPLTPKDFAKTTAMFTRWKDGIQFSLNGGEVCRRRDLDSPSSFSSKGILSLFARTVDHQMDQESRDEDVTDAGSYSPSSQIVAIAISEGKVSLEDGYQAWKDAYSRVARAEQRTVSGYGFEVDISFLSMDEALAPFASLNDPMEKYK